MKTISKLILLALILLCIISIPKETFAREPQGADAGGGGGTTTYAGLVGGINGNKNLDSSSMQDVVENVLGFLQAASALLTLVMIAVTGFRYITETPDMKHELKKSMIPIIVGLLLVFSAVSITKFFISMFET